MALHGALPQGLRNRRLNALRDGHVQILVATDVAARGIDVPTITHVFNFGLPMKPEDYTHRIGRTGRAGRSGLAITFAEWRDQRRMHAIEQHTRQPLQAETVAGLEPRARPKAPARPRKQTPASRPAGRRDGRFHTRVEGRDFTATEQRIIQGLLGVVFTEYSKSWKPVHEITFEYIRSEMNSQFANIATPSEIVVSTSFTLEFGGATADMHICFPYSMLEPIRDLLYSTMQSDQLSTDKRWIGTLRRQLQGAEVEIVAQLGHGQVSLREILHLKPGDVIPITIPPRVEAVVDNVPLMECTYGQQNGQYALRIEKFLASTPEGNPEPGLGEKHV